MEKEAFLDFNWFAFSFANSDYLWLLLLLPLLAYLLIRRNKTKNSTLAYSSEVSFSKVKNYNFIPISLGTLLLLSFGCLILALARPQSTNDGVLTQKIVEGIDIVIALDVSESMLAEDFKPNRLEAAKDVAIQFIKDRPQDKIGLVVYEGESFTQCPLTNDHKVLIEKFKEVKTGLMEPGTAIGLGLATAVNRLRESTAKSKVIILLSDGVSNQGSIDPITAAELASEFNIRVYSIGVGKEGLAPFPARDPFGGIFKTNLPVSIDEVTLKKIASLTEGKYFRAQSKKSLEKIYKEIDKMEKTKVKVNEFKLDPPEKYHSFLVVALLGFLLFFLLKNNVMVGIHD